MNATLRMIATTAGVLTLVGALAPTVFAQVGRGLVDPNTASEGEIAALPHLTPAIAKSLVAKRPLMSAIELNQFLIDQKLTPAQTAEIYRRAFVHVNLNTATREEFLLIPGSGVRMSREFAEYRPWRNWAQFDREISKYVGQPDTDRFKQYLFIPLSVGTASDADLMTIPGMTPGLLRQMKELQPKTKEQFDSVIGKAVGPKEAARLGRYVVLQ